MRVTSNGVAAPGCAPPVTWSKGPWRYAEISGATHWIPLDAPEELNALLLDWLGSARDRPVP
jgi:hypothetical protein